MTDEEKFHLYVLNKSLLSETDLREIENRKNSDEEFARLISELEKINSDLIFHESDDSVLTSLAARMISGNMNYLVLKPVFKDDDNNSALRLAAMNEVKQEKGFIYFNTFASADNLILIRILKNPSDNTYKLFILTEIPDRAKYCVLKINNSGSEFIADERGTVTLQSDHLHKNIEISVLLPLDIFSFDASKPDKIYLSETSSKSAVSVSWENGLLNVSFEKDYASDKTFFVVFDNDFSNYLKFSKIEGDSLTIDNSLKKATGIKIISISIIS